jgi:hypothetical protein
MRRPGEKLAWRKLWPELECFATPSKDGEHYDDPLDIAVSLLPMEYIDDLSARHTFLTLDQLDPADPCLPKGSGYVATGFPWLLSGFSDGIFNINSLLLGGTRYDKPTPDQKVYDPGLHVGLLYEGEYFFNRDLKDAGQLPNTKGISGGAIWRTIDAGRPKEDLGPQHVRLVGIIHNRYPKPPLIVGTQIELTLAHIMRVIPESAEAIRESIPKWSRPGWAPRLD